MTFDYTDNSSPLVDREYSLPLSSGHAVLRSPSNKQKENYNDDIETQVWENEGGADACGTDRIHSHYSLTENNPIFQMVDDAFDQLEDECFEDAVQTITAIMEHSASCHNQVRDLVKHAIERLSTFGHPADPPHPGALALIKRRQKLAL